MNIHSKSRHVRAFQNIETALSSFDDALARARRTLKDAKPDEAGDVRADDTVRQVMHDLIWGNVNAMNSINVAMSQLQEAHDYEVQELQYAILAAKEEQ